jgi:tRNA(fMet)-specific endonuclease VapC
MALRYLLDTNICIYIAKKKLSNILDKFEQLSIGEVGMSAVTYGELFYGVQKSHSPKKGFIALDDLTGLIPPLPLSTEVARHYGEIRALLEKKGKPIGNNDLWIASHALALDVILVTNNMKEFSRILHLKTENWLS